MFPPLILPPPIFPSVLFPARGAVGTGGYSPDVDPGIDPLYRVTGWGLVVVMLSFLFVCTLIGMEAYLDRVSGIWDTAAFGPKTDELAALQCQAANSRATTLASVVPHPR